MDGDLEDDETVEKVFMLAGNWDNDLKADIIAKIRSLEGTYLESDVWNPQCTHVIAK